MRRSLLHTVCVVIALGLALPSLPLGRAGHAHGAAATHATATDRVRGFFASANRVIVDPLYDGRHDARLAALRELVTEMVDFRNAAALALGAEWSRRSSAERDEFVRLFTDLLETSVFASVGARARIDGSGISVAYAGEEQADHATIVKTTLVTRSDRELAIGFRMAPRAASWVVQDVVVDGVSLVDNYRAQFQKFMQRSSYAGLVSEMRTRIADLGRTPATVVVAAPPLVAAAVVVAAAPMSVAATPSPVVTAAAAPPTVPPVGASAPSFPVAAPQPSVKPAPAIVAAIRPAVTPAPATSALEPMRPTTRGERFWVQVGAFRSADRAMEVAAALRDQTVSLFSAPPDSLLRVVVGPFGDRHAAASKLREIRARGYDAFIASP